MCFTAGPVHQQSVCLRAQPELQPGPVAHVPLPAHLHPRNTHGTESSHTGFEFCHLHLKEQAVGETSARHVPTAVTNLSYMNPELGREAEMFL